MASKAYWAMVEQADEDVVDVAEELTRHIVRLVEIAMPPSPQLDALREAVRQAIYRSRCELREHISSYADAYAESDGPGLAAEPSEQEDEGCSG